MSSITAQQTKLDLELVPKEKRLNIRKCNKRLNPGKKQREPTFQVIMDALALTPCHSAFLTTTDVPEVYMHQFGRSSTLICPRVYGQNFDKLPTDEDIMSFFKELDHTREIKSITDVVVDQMHQPWRTLPLSSTEVYLERQLSLTKSLSFLAIMLLRNMYYPRFTKVIIHHFLTKDKTVSKRNKIGMHTSRDDYVINTLRFVSTKEESQIYEARLPKSMTSLKMRETKAYNTYLGYATGVTPPNKARKFKKHASPKLSTVPNTPEEPTRKSKRIKRPTKKSTNAPTTCVFIRETPVMYLSKKKEKMTVEKRKGIDLISEGRDEDDSNNEHDSSSEGNDQEKDTGDDNTQSENETGSYEIVSLIDVYVHHEVPNKQTPTLLTVPVLVITDSSPVYSTAISQSLPSFTSPPQQSTLTPPPTTKATTPPSTLLNFASVFQFNDRVLALEKDVAELKKDDILNTQVTSLVDDI
ncbi:hypothetical protein Tco_1448356 [Tanacetum coccineum]